jgi:hypothetical protein
LTSNVALFELGRALVEVHENGVPDGLTVITVLVDDLGESLPVLQALTEMTDGRLFDAAPRDATPTDMDRPVPGAANTVRRAAVAELNWPGVAREMVLQDLPEGYVDAVFKSGGADASPGERMVLAIARAVVHQDFGERPLVVIAYTETAVDVLYREAIWRLAIDRLRGTTEPTCRTVMFVAQGSINVRRHCQYQKGFRFAISDGRLLKRNVDQDVVSVAAQIARTSEPLVLFLGAGFSESSGMPLGTDLRDRAIRRLLGLDSSDPSSPIALAEQFHAWVSDKNGWLSTEERQLSRANYARSLTLEQVVRAEERFDSSLPTLREFLKHHDEVVDKPGSSVTDLAALVESSNLRIVLVEVNFDRLIEHNLKVPLRVFATESDFGDAPDYLTRYLSGAETKLPLLKLHGTIEDLGSCVISSGTTELGLGKNKRSALEQLLDQKQPRMWVYIGASLRDLDLRPTLSQPQFATGLAERWVMPYLDQGVADFASAREKFWNNTGLPHIGDRLVTETSDTFFAALRKAAVP